MKHVVAGLSALGLAGLVLVGAQPTEQTTAAAIMPPAPATVALEVHEVAMAAERDAARVAAEISRSEVPAVLAERAEAERAARAAAEAEARAAEARAAQARAAAEAAAEKQAAARSASAQAPSAPRTTDYGIAASSYTGPLYSAAYESTRQCIVRKESGGNYGIVSSNGLYHGAYQFSRATGDATAQRMGRPDLVGTAVSSWSRYDQDMAFWTLWNNGAGRGNWPTANGC